MEERRRARVGNVCGLTLLTGGTAIAAVSGGAHSALTTIALGGLAVALAHSLLDEIRRQATRSSGGAWSAEDTVNTGLLGGAATLALVLAVLTVAPVRVRVLGVVLAIGYAAYAGYFSWQRRHTIRSTGVAGAAPARTTRR